MKLNVGTGKQQSRCVIKLHLHIGTEKTGTTSFQVWLKTHHEKLAEHGFNRPEWPARFLSRYNHRMLPIFAQGVELNDDGQIALGIKSAAQHKNMCDDFKRTFAAEIAQRGEGEWIISSEHMQSRLLRAGQVNRLAQFLEPFFDEVVVHLHLRPQVDLARSIASTLSRGVGRVSQSTFRSVNEENPYYNYQTLVERWSNAFSASQVKLIPYKRVPSIRSYFVDLWGLDAAEFGAEIRANGAVDWRVMALVNSIYPHRHQLLSIPQLQEALSIIPTETPLQLGLPMAQDITARMLASNEALVMARPDLTLDDFTPNWADYHAEENLSRLDVQCDYSAQSVALISELQGKLILEKARTNVVRAKNSFLLGHERRAYKWLKEATDLMIQIEPTWKDRNAFIELNNYISKVVLDGTD